MTDAEKAKLFDMLQRGKELRTRLAVLDEQLDEHTRSWTTLAQAISSDLGETVFRPGDGEIDVLRPWPNGVVPRNRPPLNMVESVRREHFDSDALCKLLTERQAARTELKKVGERLRDAGMPF